MTLNEIMDIYRCAIAEAEHGIIDKINENGRVTLKAGSPSLAALWALDEVFMELLGHLIAQRTAVAQLFDLSE